MKKKKNPLKEFLVNNGIKQNWFAERIGVSSRTIAGICYGRKCCLIIARAIEKETRGVVEAKDISSSIILHPVKQKTFKFKGKTNG